MRSPALVLVLVLVLDVALGSAAARADEAAPLRRETASGPVTAVVTLAPGHPMLGDRVTLDLSVTSAPGIDVRMPAFGEALGRFEIVDYAPRRESLPDGSTVQAQRYTLELPMSGRQTVPPLLIEFVDRRPAPGAAGKAPDVKELLTEELTVDVRSALAETATGTSLALRPPRGRLDERWPPPPPASRVIAAVLGLAALIAGALGRRAWVEAKRLRARRTAFDVASARLRAVEERGMPAPEAVDAWYVELSAIVRRYIEDRFGLRAPELTTQEFMLDVKGSAALAAAHGAILGTFLERCDRVKFAAWRPGEAESREALAAARRFLEETREGAPVVGARPGGAA